VIISKTKENFSKLTVEKWIIEFFFHVKVKIIFNHTLKSCNFGCSNILVTRKENPSFGYTTIRGESFITKMNVVPLAFQKVIVVDVFLYIRIFFLLRTCK